MPIRCPIRPTPISKDGYHRLDYEIMRLIFETQNELGCLCDEKIYQREIQLRCQEHGHDAQREVPIEVAHKTFTKTYYVDLVIDCCVLYELKTAGAFSPRHRGQTLNYLFLMGFKYGKLVNMRPPSVEWEFVTTTIGPEDRRQFDIVKEAWLDLDDASAWLRELVTELLFEWGVFLDTQLFSEAIGHFQGTDEWRTKPIQIINDGRPLGMQTVHLLTPEIAIRLSSVKDSQSSHEEQMRRFLKHTPLRAVHWINFNRHEVLMKTLTQ